MRSATLFAAAAVLLLAVAHFAAAADADFNDPSVVVLNSGNFADVVGSKDAALVEFYAPWCGHCKNLAPEYQKLAEAMNTDSSPVVIAKVDATKDADLASKYKVEGYPTIYFFKKGSDTPRPYKGARKADAMKSWLEGQLGPAVSTLSTEADAQSLIDKNDKLLAIGFIGADSESARTVFEGIADEMRDKLKFALVTDASVAKALGVTALPAVVLYRKFDEPRIEFTDASFTRSKLGGFLEKNSMPVFGELTYDNASDYLSRNKPFVLLFVDLKETEANQKLIESLKPVAADYADILTFIYLDNAKFGSHQTRLGLPGKTPALAIDDFSRNQHFPLFQELTEPALREFVSSYKAGSLQPFLKSEPIPEKNDAPVKVVVGKSFEQLALDDSKDVLVEFYAPWCGHCKNLAPIYDKLAESLQGVSSLVIAKMDATANDPPSSIQVSSFPTIIFFPAGKKQSPINFNGDRTVEGFTKFLKEHATHKFDTEGKKDEL